MKISLFNNIQSIKYNNSNVSIPIQNNLSSLKEDTVSFTSKFSFIQDQLRKREVKVALNLKSNQELNIDEAKKVFEYFGIETEKTEDNKLIISEYKQPSEYSSFSNYRINEDELLKHVVQINGNADFKYSKAKSIGSVEIIKGNADFEGSKIKDLCNLTTIEGNADFYNCNIKNASNLKTINGNADFMFAKIEDIKNLEYIGGDADFKLSQIKDLSGLKVINGNADFYRSEVANLDSLRYIGGNADFACRKNSINLKDIKIDGKLYLDDPTNVIFFGYVLCKEILKGE